MAQLLQREIGIALKFRQQFSIYFVNIVHK